MLAGASSIGGPRGNAGTPSSSRRRPAAATGGSGGSSTPLLGTSPQLSATRLWPAHSLSGAGDARSPVATAAHSDRAEKQLPSSAGGRGRGSQRRRPASVASNSSTAGSSGTSGSSSSTASSSPTEPLLAARPQRPASPPAVGSLLERPLRRQVEPSPTPPAVQQGPRSPPRGSSGGRYGGGRGSGRGGRGRGGRGGVSDGAADSWKAREASWRTSPPPSTWALSQDIRQQQAQQQQAQQQQTRQQQQQPQQHQRLQAQQDAPQGRAPAFLIYGQQQQQMRQQVLLREKHYRQEKLRVPFWVRQLAGEVLQVLAAAEAIEGASAEGDAAASVASLQLPPDKVQKQILHLLPQPMVQPPAEQAEQQAGDQQQQKGVADTGPAGHRTAAAASLPAEERHEAAATGSPAAGAAAAAATPAAELQRLVEQEQGLGGQLQQHPEQPSSAQAAAEPGACAAQAEAVQPAEEEVLSEEEPATGAGPGDIFAAELARIMMHYQEAQGSQEALAGEDDEAPAGSPAASDGPASGGSAAAVAAGGAAAQPGAASKGNSWRQRRVDEGGFMFVMRALSLMGDGVRSALAVLLTADVSPLPYPTRSPAVFNLMLRLANSLQEWETAVALVDYAKQWEVPLDRSMWQCVLDVCAKAGRPDLVRQLMKDMAAAGVEPDSVAHTILLMAHEKAGQWEAALEAYAEMQRLGLPRNSFTYRALVAALVSANRLEAACETLDWMAEDGVAGNAVVYQTLINAFLERGQHAQVDQLLERMRRDGVRFSHQAVGRLSGFCFSRSQPQLAFQLFKRIREMGLLRLEPAEGSGVAGPADAAAGGLQSGSDSGGEEEGEGKAAPGFEGLELSSGSDEEGEGDERQAEAQQQRRADQVQAAHSYCRMIAACQKARLLEEAWEVYAWMREDGLSPDRATYSRLISVCAYSPARAREAEELYQRLLEERVELDAFMYLHLVTAIASGSDGGQQRWDAVLRVLHGMQMGMPNYKDTHVQTVAVSMAAKHGRLADALAVYRLMLQDGVQPKSPTFNALIAACMRAGAPASGFRFFDIMQAMGVKADVVTVSTLIACCERLGDWQRAQEVWSWMESQGLEPDTICYNTMISCMERSNQPDRALAVFEDMMEAGVAGSSATYATLCDVFAKQGKWEKLRTAVQVKEWMEAQGEDPAQLTYAQLMDKASQGGNWQKALELFDGMESSLALSGSQPNGVTYSAAIIACARLADWQRAVELKDQMLARALPATPIVYNSVLAACEAACQLEPALDVLDEMRVAGVPRDQYTYSTLISCCYRVGGQLDAAMRLFAEMQEEGLVPNTVVVNALLSVCAAVGDADAAVEVYRHVTDVLRLPPDDITMHCMMEALGRRGRWAEGLRYLVASYEELGTHRGVMQLDLASPEAGHLDLHFLSVQGAHIVLRAWLLYLKRCALQGERLPADAVFKIITGWGRNSANNVPRLKPEVGRMLQHELGAPLAVEEPPSNTGVYCVSPEGMYEWLLHGAQLGFSREEEEEVWSMMQALRQTQLQEAKAAQQPRQAQQPQQEEWQQP